MSIPISQMVTVASYVLGKRLRGVKRYPLVLMLEPLFRCNLACAGCGKIQHPAEILRKNLTPEQCFHAAEECGAPMVSIPGGEPLLHPQIEEIVAGLVARKKYVYMCTNAIKLKEMLDRFTPSKYLAFSVHLDGPREEHDHAVCRDGVYDIAVEAVKAACARGFRVTTNSTFFLNADPERMRGHFDQMMQLGVEGMMISPGYPYEKAPDQENFLHRKQTQQLFRRLLGNARKAWKFNQSPLFLEFLKGQYDLDCTPWGNPAYNVFGWQKPCYLLDEGYCETFAELMETTAWNEYGQRSGNSKCTDCMVHCGYEPSAVDATFNTWRGFLTTVRLSLFGAPRLPEEPPSENPVPAPHARPAGQRFQLPIID
ncbi:adenosyl-hopene transferase HpnH [Lignipirellula cremea]|uniref:Cyclic pyranopterin monophosphate synthase n=1 Tax=Lignipirellula cremea TaxID=2528010 RepID=A0A518DRJ4_9BACT|nr:adenosyl-hopene transferase HpnH [Lignipirellula cremea]QDU94443.1 Cyclic pyranopterin monophosphate synthase [Lignipirellula cremea]